MRVMTMKAMLPLFTAFNYHKLILNHLQDLVRAPKPVLTMFRQGGFVVNVSGRPWQTVGIDEVHEMLFYKDCKKTIMRPLPDYISRLAKYMSYRSKAMENFEEQILPPASADVEIMPLITTNTNAIKSEANMYT